MATWFLAQVRSVVGDVELAPGDRVVIWDHPTHPVAVLRSTELAPSALLEAVACGALVGLTETDVAVGQGRAERAQALGQPTLRLVR